MAFQDESLQQAFMNILDVYSGVDGGVQFVKFRFMLEQFEKSYIDHQNESAKQLLDIVKQFSRLINHAQ